MDSFKVVFRGSIRKVKNIFLMFFLVVFTTCVEPFQTDFDSSESYLVVEATITNELKSQEIKLSRTFEIDEDGPNPEMGASIHITASNGEQYDFIEELDGIYKSIDEFQATPNISYRLNIITNNGNTYQSTEENTPPEASIENLFAERTFNERGELGLGIFTDIFSNSNKSIYLRYEYEETYKIVAPFWVGRDVLSVVLSSNGVIIPKFDVRPITEQTCYKTLANSEIITTNTNTISTSNITKFPIKFIEVDNISLAERFTIKVVQYVQNRNANIFYETLRSFSETGNLFSQIQTGFIDGNINSLDNKDEKIIGFFDITTVTNERIFIDRMDFFNENDPIFEYDCRVNEPIQGAEESLDGFAKRLSALAVLFKYLENSSISFFKFITRECGDCTVIGKSEKPDFWID